MTFLLLACAGADVDTGDPLDTALPATGLARADAAWVGAPSTGAGSAVTGVGDLDGDGAAEVVVTAFYGNQACAWPYVAGVHALADGACYTGVSPYDFFGYSVAGVGDVDADGLPDVVVGAIGSDVAASEAGEVYLLPGPWRGGSAADALASWTGQLGGDLAGASVASAGDTDGDGDPEILIGAAGSDAGGSGSGRVFLVKGPFAGTSSLSAAFATFTGETSTPAALGHGSVVGGDALGDAVAGAGDIDGDGLDDLALGGSGADEAGSDAGVVWILRGPVDAGDHRMADADVRLTGPVPSAFLGGALASAGDVDGDGHVDLLVAADGVEGGRVYVVSGGLTNGARSVDSDDPGAFTGTNEGDVAGWSVAGGGDTDGDGRPEVWIGAPGLDGAGEDAGGVYLVHDAGGPGVRALADVGIRLDAEAAGDSAGRSVGSAGDLDGDGLADLLVGALYNQTGGVFAGKAYLILGE